MAFYFSVKHLICTDKDIHPLIGLWRPYQLCLTDYQQPLPSPVSWVYCGRVEGCPNSLYPPPWYASVNVLPYWLLTTLTIACLFSILRPGWGVPRFFILLDMRQWTFCPTDYQLPLPLTVSSVYCGRVEGRPDSLYPFPDMRQWTFCPTDYQLPLPLTVSSVYCGRVEGCPDSLYSPVTRGHERFALSSSSLLCLLGEACMMSSIYNTCWGECGWIIHKDIMVHVKKLQSMKFKAALNHCGDLCKFKTKQIILSFL